MHIEAQQWIADFRTAAGFYSFPFFWVLGVVFFLIGSFLTFSAF